MTLYLTKCCSRYLSWWANTFSIMPRMLIGGLGKYSNQCCAQLAEMIKSHVDDKCNMKVYLSYMFYFVLFYFVLCFTLIKCLYDRRFNHGFEVFNVCCDPRSILMPSYKLNFNNYSNIFSIFLAPILRWHRWNKCMQITSISVKITSFEIYR